MTTPLVAEMMHIALAIEDSKLCGAASCVVEVCGHYHCSHPCTWVRKSRASNELGETA